MGDVEEKKKEEADHTREAEEIQKLIDSISKGSSSPEINNNLNFYDDVEKESKKTVDEAEKWGILGMRNKWSNCILMLITAIVLFDMMLVCYYGLGIWTFSNTGVVIAVISDNFLKIVGLGILIVQAIFRRN